MTLSDTEPLHPRGGDTWERQMQTPRIQDVECCAKIIS